MLKLFCQLLLLNFGISGNKGNKGYKGIRLLKTLYPYTHIYSIIFAKYNIISNDKN